MLQGRLFRKYALYLTGLLSAALLVSGLIGVYFSYRDTRAMVEELQREKARVAATRIEQFMQTAEVQLRGALPLATVGVAQNDEPEYLELLKLLRLAPAISNATWINAAGRERVLVSRVTRDVVGSNIDRSDDLAFRVATDRGIWHGPVFFNRGSEPYVGTAVADQERPTGVVVADINLKFVQDVVSAIRSGTAGHAYLVDAKGRLISHPDMSLVLKLTDLSAQPQVAASLVPSGASEMPVQSLIAKNQTGVWTLTAYAPIEILGWKIFLEQPLSEALAPLIGSVLRSGLVLLLGIGLAIVASRMLARQMVAPITNAGSGRRPAGRGTARRTCGGADTG